MLKVLLTVIFLSLPTTALVQNDMSEDQIQQKLKNIKQRLTDVKNSLNQAEGEESKLLKELERQDQSINKQGKLIRNIKQQIEKSQQQIDALNSQIDKKSKGIETQKDQIADLLKLNIYINHDRILKMVLLNPKTRSAEVTQHQIKFLQNKLYSLISTIAEQIKQLKDIKQTLDAQQSELLTQKVQLDAENNSLLEQKQQRTVVLKNLQKTIKQYQTENQSLTKDSKRLNSLLSQINDLLDDLPADLGKNTTFSKLKGTLIKPLVGKIIRSYRSLRSGQSKWDGIVIGTEAGKEVKSVAYGRVAFADWLRGYGLLIVLDHGDDYMTLYGHNQSILVEAGDWVQAKQAIATSGNSGNINPSGVFFEIRKKAQPTNPNPWFKRK